MKKNIQVRIIVAVLAIVMSISNMNTSYIHAEEVEEMVEIIFVDETEESWISNDNACMETCRQYQWS